MQFTVIGNIPMLWGFSCDNNAMVNWSDMTGFTKGRLNGPITSGTRVSMSFGISKAYPSQVRPIKCTLSAYPNSPELKDLTTGTRA